MSKDLARHHRIYLALTKEKKNEQIYFLQKKGKKEQKRKETVHTRKKEKKNGSKLKQVENVVQICGSFKYAHENLIVYFNFLLYY